MSLSTLSGIESSTLFGILFEYGRTSRAVGRDTYADDGAVPSGLTLRTMSRSLAVARTAGIPYRTAHRLVSEYSRIALMALVRKKRTDRGERRALSAKLKEPIEGLALAKVPLPIAALYRQFHGSRKSLAKSCYLFGNRLATNSAMRLAAGGSRLLNTATTYPAFGNILRSPFIPGAAPPCPVQRIPLTTSSLKP